MSRKIFTAIWGAALAVFAASLVFIMGVSYNYFTGVQMKQLHAETALAAQGVSLCGKDYFTGLSTGDYRVTWIDADGTVLFDTGADASRMENHLEREEIRQALQNGTGEARRYSPTLADRQLYAAQRLPDGTVLRLGRAARALVACARVCAADLPCGAARAWALVPARLAAHKKNRRAHQCH